MQSCGTALRDLAAVHASGSGGKVCATAQQGEIRVY